jgi:hypothetical protein
MSGALAQAPTQPPARTATTLAAESAGPSAGGFTLSAHVTTSHDTQQSATATPASQTDAATLGNVTFLDTDATGMVHELGSAPVDADGVATLHAGPLTAGAHDLRAVFNGTATARSSTSAAAQLTAEATTTPDYALTATPTSLNLQAGMQGSVAISIAPVNGFSSYVSLSCAGLPLFTTCSFQPSNVSVSASAGRSTMTLDTVAPSGNTALLHHDTGLIYAFLLPGALGLAALGLAGRSRSLRTLALLCVAGSLMAGASSCAQRYTYLHRGPTPNPGTPNGNSVIRIFGTSVNGAQATVHCVQIALTVVSTNTNSGGNILTPCPAS